MPESTLTPAPVIVVTFPDARKSAIRSAAAAGLMDFAAVVDDKIDVGMVGTEMRICHPRVRVCFPEVYSPET